MPLLGWKEEFSVQVSLIDRQHRKLFRLLNNLYDSLLAEKGDDVVGRVLDDLVRYTEAHFLTEERLMKTHGYSGFHQHKVEHDALTRKVLDFRKNFNSGKTSIPLELLHFLRDWLNNHILGTDKRYSAFFQSRGIR